MCEHVCDSERQTDRQIETGTDRERETDTLGGREGRERDRQR